MQGVTTALVSFIFVCVVFPNLIKNRTQYYAAFVAVCLIILFDSMGMAVSATEFGKFRAFTYTVCALLQIAAVVLLFLAAGGISWRAFAHDMQNAFEVIRRGGEEKEVIIPLSPEMERLRAQRQAAAAAQRGASQPEPEQRERINLNDPSIPPPAPPSPAASGASNEPSPLEPKPPESGGIPLEP